MAQTLEIVIRARDLASKQVLGVGQNAVRMYQLMRAGTVEALSAQRRLINELNNLNQTIVAIIRVAEEQGKRLVPPQTAEMVIRRLAKIYHQLGDSERFATDAGQRLQQVLTQFKAGKMNARELSNELSNLTTLLTQAAQKAGETGAGQRITAASFNRAAESVRKLNEHLRGMATRTSMGRRALRGMISGLSKFGQLVEKTTNVIYRFRYALVGLGVIFQAVLAPAVVSFKPAMTFEHAMRRLLAVSRATAYQFQQLRVRALQMGQTTVYSASQVAEAMTFLSMAGFSVREVMQSVAAVIRLATIEGIDLADATRIVTGTIRAFGMEAKEAGTVVDVLASVSTRTNTTLEELGVALGYVAPLAREVGADVRETAAAIGILSNANIRGSLAGTALRRILATLSDVSSEGSRRLREYGVVVTDLHGRMLDLSDILEQLAKLEPWQRMSAFQVRAGPAINQLVRYRDQLRTLVEQTRIAEFESVRMANIIGGSVRNSLTRTWNALKNVAIAFSDFIRLMDIARFGLDAMTKLFSGVAGILSKIARAVWGSKTRFQELSGAISETNEVLKTFFETEPQAPVDRIIAVLEGALKRLSDASEELSTKTVDELFSSIEEAASRGGGDMSSVLTRFNAKVLEGMGVARDKAQAIADSVNIVLSNMNESLSATSSRIRELSELRSKMLWSPVKPAEFTLGVVDTAALRDLNEQMRKLQLEEQKIQAEALQNAIKMLVEAFKEVKRTQIDEHIKSVRNQFAEALGTSDAFTSKANELYKSLQAVSEYLGVTGGEAANFAKYLESTEKSVADFSREGALAAAAMYVYKDALSKTYGTAEEALEAIATAHQRAAAMFQAINQHFDQMEQNLADVKDRITKTIQSLVTAGAEAGFGVGVVPPDMLPPAFGIESIEELDRRIAKLSGDYNKVLGDLVQKATDLSGKTHLTASEMEEYNKLLKEAAALEVQLNALLSQRNRLQTDQNSLMSEYERLLERAMGILEPTALAEKLAGRSAADLAATADELEAQLRRRVTLLRRFFEEEVGRAPTEETLEKLKGQLEEIEALQRRAAETRRAANEAAVQEAQDWMIANYGNIQILQSLESTFERFTVTVIRSSGDMQVAFNNALEAMATEFTRVIVSMIAKLIIVKALMAMGAPTEVFGMMGLEDFAKFVGAIPKQVGGPVVDSIPAVLQPGEFVLSRAAASRIGRGTLASLNAGVLPPTDSGMVVEVHNTVKVEGDLDAEEVAAVVRREFDKRIIPSLIGVREGRWA